jgi:multiple antibiotic resistance protein
MLFCVWLIQFIKVLGNRGSMIVSRVFAVIIAAIAVEYIVEGIKNIFVF